MEVRVNKKIALKGYCKEIAQVASHVSDLASRTYPDTPIKLFEAIIRQGERLLTLKKEYDGLKALKDEG